jgi:hypothetical protein
MLTWAEFRDERPDLAEAGRALMYQFGVGLGMLATVRRDGGPRVHPMCPIVAGDGLFALIEPGPKRGDLERDGRYALHSFPPADNEDAFYVTGRADAVADEDRAAPVREQFWVERGQTGPPNEAAEHNRLFEFRIERCLLTRTSGHGDWNPQHTIWP